MFHPLERRPAPSVASLSSQPRRGTGGPSVVLLLLLAVSTGCAKKERITMTELDVLQQELAAAPSVPVAPPELALTDYQPYRVQPGDVLDVRLIGLGVDRYAPVVLTLRVYEDGTIVMPAVGPVPVAGRDLGAVEQAIRAAHVPEIVKDLAVFVAPARTESSTVLVLGAAGEPGIVKLAENERNPIYALSAAGGFTELGSGRIRVKPIRPDRPAQTYDLGDINDVRRAMLAPPLESGDVVEVEAAPRAAVYIVGLVNLPGAIPIPPRSSLSILRAIASAGGLQPYLTISEAVLVRRLGDGRQVQVKVDLGAIAAGSAPDVELRAGDILQVPHTLDTLVQEWFIKNVMAGPFSVSVRYDPLQQYNTDRAIEASREHSSVQDSLLGVIPSLLVPQVPVP
jgi:polysaccharide biosynthesis/export protein